MDHQSTNQKINTMKNLLFVITVLILIIWGLVFWGFDAPFEAHILLLLAGFIVFVRLHFSKQLN